MIERLLAWVIIIVDKFIPKRKNNGNTLIFIDGGIGDLVMYMPAIGLFYFSHQVTFYCNQQPHKDILKEHFPQSDFDLSKNFGCAAWDCHVKKKHILFVMLKRIPVRIGEPSDKWSPFFTLCNKGIYQVDINQYSLEQKMFFNTHKPDIRLPKNYIVIHPFNSHRGRSKEYPRWDKVMNQLMYDRTLIVMIGGKEERKYTEFNWMNFLDLRGKLTIFESAWVIQRSKHFYTNEGGMAHIAAALGVRSTIYIREDIRESTIHKHMKHLKYHTWRKRVPVNLYDVEDNINATINI